MQRFFSWLLQVETLDEDVRWRGRNVVLLSLSMSVMAFLFVPVTLLMGPPNLTIYAMIGVTILLYLGIATLARYGPVALGGVLFVVLGTCSVLGSILLTGQVSITPFFLVPTVLAASLMLRPWHIWIVLAINAGGLIGTVLLLPVSPFGNPTGIQDVSGSLLLLGVAAVMSFLGAKTTDTALAQSRVANAEFRQAAQALARVNTDLETTVAERTAALQNALAEVQTRADEQERLLAEVDRQRRAIRDLSVPVIPISTKTLIMPLIGELDTGRLAQMQERALQALQRTRARYLVLDITGIPMVDTQVAQGLVAVVDAARLLGAQVIMVGIRPEVAQSIVGLGLGFQGMRTAIDLQSALGQLALN